MEKKRAVKAKLTIVTPVFNEVDNLDDYIARVLGVFSLSDNIELDCLLVDDGSTDGSWSKINEIARARPEVRGIRLSRNFGAHLAIAAGFDAVGPCADAVAILACDLQDPPSVILEFLSSWRAGADIVWGSRRTRKERGWRAVASRMLDGLLRRYAMPRGSKFRTGSFLLVDRVVLDCFLSYREHSRVTFALVAWTGFDQAVVEYDRQSRVAGRSGWTFGRMLNTAYDVFVGFSPLPAKMVSALGFAFFGLSLVGIAYLFIVWMLQSVQPGWTGLMATIVFLFGILFMMIGMIAEYLHRIFVETTGRPLYFVSDRTRRAEMDPSKD